MVAHSGDSIFIMLKSINAKDELSSICRHRLDDTSASSDWIFLSAIEITHHRKEVGDMHEL